MNYAERDMIALQYAADMIQCKVDDLPKQIIHKITMMNTFIKRAKPDREEWDYSCLRSTQAIAGIVYDYYNSINYWG